MSGFVTLGVRGTDVITAALTLGNRFTRRELVDAYGNLRRSRGDTLPQWWDQGISNELQRLSSDCSRYHKEHRQLDLIGMMGKGEYCLRDAARPKLLEAANARADLLLCVNTLVVPVETVVFTDHENRFNHVVGQYAQHRIMRAMQDRGFEIMRDTSKDHAYDFVFMDRARRQTAVQTMECKGTRRGSGAEFAFTANEIMVMAENLNSYWLGVVYDIKIENGVAVGGSDPFITGPPIFKEDRWSLIGAIRMRHIVPAPQLEIFGQRS
jgi:hypothetical protein